MRVTLDVSDSEGLDQPPDDLPPWERSAAVRRGCKRKLEIYGLGFGLPSLALGGLAGAAVMILREVAQRRWSQQAAGQAHGSQPVGLGKVFRYCGWMSRPAKSTLPERLSRITKKKGWSARKTGSIRAERAPTTTPVAAAASVPSSLISTNAL